MIALPGEEVSGTPSEQKRRHDRRLIRHFYNKSLMEKKL